MWWNVCVYVHVYVCTRFALRICTCSFYTSECLCMYACMQAYMSPSLCASIHLCVFAFVCAAFGKLDDSIKPSGTTALDFQPGAWQPNPQNHTCSKQAWQGTGMSPTSLAVRNAVNQALLMPGACFGCRRLRLYVRRLQYPLIKEYSLNCNRIPNMI